MVEASWDALPRRARDLFGLELGAAELDRLNRHLDLVEAWSTRMNLVAARSRGELIDRHLLDSLALRRFARDAAHAVDLGSGAGFPAIPLAIVLPLVRFDLVEVRGKRATFLRQVIRTLELGNARVCEERAEAWGPPGAVDLVIGRALAREVLAAVAARILERGGRLVLMRKASAAVPSLERFTVRERFPYELPGGLRHEIVVLERIE